MKMKSRFTYYLISVGMLLSIHLKAQTTATFRLNAGDEDAKIQDYKPNQNDGNAIEHYLSGWTISGTPIKSRGLMKFNLSSIPTSAVVQSAHLSLYYPTINDNHSFHYDTSLTHSN